MQQKFLQQWLDYSSTEIHFEVCYLETVNQHKLNTESVVRSSIIADLNFKMWFYLRIYIHPYRILATVWSYLHRKLIS
jgi:hypothetical protein